MPATPAAAVVWPMFGTPESIAESAAASISEAVERLDGGTAAGAILFDCIGLRSLQHGFGAVDVARRLTASLGGAPYAGTYTLGEIARRTGAGGFHNQSLVSVVFG